MSYLRDTALSGAATAVFAVGRFIGMALIARALGSEVFGVLAVTLLCIDLLGRGALFGLGGVTTRFSVVVREDERARWRQLRRRWAVCSLVFLLTAGPAVGARYLAFDGLTLALFVFWAVATSLRIVADSLYSGAFRFDLRILATFLNATVLVLGGWLFVQPQDIQSAMLVLALGALAHFLPVLLPGRREGNSALADADRSGLPPLGTILSYGLNLWIIGFASILVWNRGEIIVVGHALSPEVLGHYGAAMTLMGLVWRTIGMLNGAVTPHITRRLDDAGRRDRFFAATTRLSLALSGVAAMALAILGGTLSVAAFGQEFAPAGDILAIMAPAGAVAGTMPAVMTVQVLSDGRFNRTSLIAGALALLGIAWVLIGPLGVTGAALTRVLVLTGIGVAAGIWLMRRRIGQLGRIVLTEIAIGTGAVALLSVIGLALDPALGVRVALFLVGSYLLMARATGAWHPPGMVRGAVTMLRGV